ncbi:Gfo/Idh/MocA family oxidoreductase [Microbacterium sp. zg.Y1090]|uniref:Gfo/Idh/MocA family protein n=1 Tax=Microbacterium TaxID=33882 RepID=UPI00214B601B|nr:MULTISPECIES: Gfo/Idh/MocA family oxidoreductase [unclassified Microbacterium]MCR2813230.1 Gfo/Idh/MocA family oxidoreductase [Microbacterium sp. zg.Y1084]MCR2819543.1 Gfo/Idh/MocA family oxidoreductase [Microbacterium sp. zg.Y1090]WIM28512.1 Gfo/Idh/MocA family oxidoreductase [Microbacterium sp. zg-Y1090]
MTTAPLRVALIGTGFMGRMHAHAWRTAHRFFDLPLTPEPALLVGRDPQRTAEAADRLGFAEAATDWRAAIEREDIDLVDICTPGDTHAEIALAALAAGKHVLCEKPLANDVVQADRMVAAAERAAAAGVVSMCGFSYRRTPALSLARRLIEDGRIGQVRHVRAQYLQDWLSDPDAPFTWRLDRDRAGSGTLGDIGAHSIDTAQWLTGDDIVGVSAMLRTFVETRPVLEEQVGLGGRASAEAPRRDVTVDDAAAFTARFGSGALGVFEATRLATGHRNSNRIEINGDRGSIAFDFRAMNELDFYDATDPAGEQGFRRIQANEPEHPYADAWWPAGHGLGYEHLFTHQIVDLVRAISDGTAVAPTFADAARVQRVLAAVEHSAARDSRYVTVEGETA